MTLSSVNEGFVLLRNLWEYNSILKYRYKKRKAYKVANMKHLPAPLAKEYKPNLAVRVFKAIYNNQKLVWSVMYSHIRCGLQGVGSLFSRRSKEVRSEDWYRANGWTKQESHTQIPSSWNPPQPKRQIQQPLGNGGLESYSTLPKQEVKYKYNIGDKVELFDGYVGVIEAREITKGRVPHIRYTYKRGRGKTYNCTEDYIKGLYKREVRERTLTHVKRISSGGGRYFTQGRVYKVVEQKVYSDNSWYVKFETNSKGEQHCRFFRDYKGVNKYADEFELIYDNEIPNPSIINNGDGTATISMQERLSPLDVYSIYQQTGKLCNYDYEIMYNNENN